MKSFFAAIMGKSWYEKWIENELGLVCFIFYVQSRKIPEIIWLLALLAKKQTICSAIFVSICGF